MPQGSTWLAGLGVVLTLVNAWAVWTVSDLKSDIRETRGMIASTSTTLTTHIDAVGQDLSSRITAISARNGVVPAEKKGPDLAAAILETRSIVEKLEGETAEDGKAIADLRGSVASLTEKLSFMQGQLSQAPWLKR